MQNVKLFLVSMQLFMCLAVYAQDNHTFKLLDNEGLAFRVPCSLVDINTHETFPVTNGVVALKNDDYNRLQKHHFSLLFTGYWTTGYFSTEYIYYSPTGYVNDKRLDTSNFMLRDVFNVKEKLYIRLRSQNNLNPKGNQ